jgi:hypothetical protein
MGLNAKKEVPLYSFNHLTTVYSLLLNPYIEYASKIITPIISTIPKMMLVIA